jgi:hypothetical protein
VKADRRFANTSARESGGSGGDQIRAGVSPEQQEGAATMNTKKYMREYYRKRKAADPAWRRRAPTMRLTLTQARQEAVQNLRDAFNDLIGAFNDLIGLVEDAYGIDPCFAEELEQTKQEVIDEIITRYPWIDPGTFVELPDGKWTLLQNLRKKSGVRPTDADE